MNLELFDRITNPTFQDNALCLADYATAYDVMIAKTASTLTEIDT